MNRGILSLFLLPLTGLAQIDQQRAAEAFKVAKTLKRRHGLARCRYHGIDGMRRWVGLGVIADNLINIGRHLAQVGA